MGPRPALMLSTVKTIPDDPVNRKYSEAIRVAQVGIGGYGHHYLKILLEEVPPSEAGLIAVVEPFPEKAPLSREVEKEGIPLFPDMDAMFAAGVVPDLVVIASPIHAHVPQSLSALERGCHVLCDKPLGAAV